MPDEQARNFGPYQVITQVGEGGMGQVLKARDTRLDRIVAVIDRLEGARANIEAAGYSFESLFTTKDLGVS